MLQSIQQRVMNAANLISHNKLAQASEILMSSIHSLQKTTSLAPLGEPSLTLSDLQFVPVSKDYKVASPEWDDEFFCLPYVFCFDQEKHGNAHITEPVTRTCIGTCLFLLGLCYQISARDTKSHQRCPDALLQTAAHFYGLSWSSLQRVFSATTLNESGASFLMMAITANMSGCCYELGELNPANAWLSSLRELLDICMLKDDNVTLDLHTFFMMTATTATGYVAAGAA